MMHEIDAWKYWNLQGTTGNALLQKAAQVLGAYPKANKTRKRECLALVVSLIKAKCYEDGIPWAEMALSEQRFVGSIPEMPAITRAERPPPPPKPKEKEEPPKGNEKDLAEHAKQLEREHKKKELAEKLAEVQAELEDLKKEE